MLACWVCSGLGGTSFADCVEEDLVLNTEPVSERRAHMAWCKEACFGMFVHWGLYSACNMDCWQMFDMGTPVKEYIETLEPKFTGKNFDAKELVGLAKAGGCKYMVMGTRHHEGYCLWDTATTDFSSVKRVPKRDFIAEYVEAAREAGIMVGFYYSLLDWRYQAYWDGPRKNPTAWEKFVDYVHAQMRELMTNYGKIDIVWFDGGWAPARNVWGFKEQHEVAVRAKAWRSRELVKMVKELQPDIVINERTLLPGDYTVAEKWYQKIDRPWEFCDTMGYYWGRSTQDLDRKSTRALLDRLIYSVAHNGNFMLNVGPKADGSLVGWQVKRMRELGQWLANHGEAIYGCKGEAEDEPQPPINMPDLTLAPWYTTCKGNTFYLNLLRYPGESFGVGNLHDFHFISAELLDTGKKLQIIHEPTRDVISAMPKRSPDPLACVVKIKVRKKTRAEVNKQQYVGLANPDELLG